jgi:hypothetical protein
MKKLFIGLAAVPFLAGVSMAGQPTPLSDSAMDQVTAGFIFDHIGIDYQKGNPPPNGPFYSITVFFPLASSPDFVLQGNPESPIPPLPVLGP